MSEALDLRLVPGTELFGKKASRFRRESFNTVSLLAYRWLVKNLWPEVGVCFLGGPSGSGKSFLALSWVVKLCRGLPILGHRSSRAGVVYVGAEDAAGIRLRMVGLRQELGELEGDTLELIGQQPDLTDPDDVADLGEKLTEARGDMAARGVRLGLVVIDTMSAAIPGADENTSKDMQPVLAALHRVANEMGLLVLLVAHTGKTWEAGLRGWSGLRGNADGLIMLEERESGAPGAGQVVKVKNGPDGARFGFALRQVTLGLDEDGDPITTCLVDECEAPEAPRKGRKPSRGDDDASLVLNAYAQVYDLGAVAILAPGADGLNGVETAHLRDFAYSKLSFGGAPPIREADESEAEHARRMRTWRNTRDQAWGRALRRLQADNKLRVHGQHVWETFAKKGVQR